MSTDNAEAYWLDARHSLTLSELSDQSGLNVSVLTELVEYGVFTPEVTSETQGFTAECVVIARTAARLHKDFDLQPNGLALAVKFMSRIQELELQLRQLQAQLPRYRR